MGQIGLRGSQIALCHPYLPAGEKSLRPFWTELDRAICKVECIGK